MFKNLTTPQKALLLGGAAVFFIGAIAVSGPDPATQTSGTPVVSEAPVVTEAPVAAPPVTEAPVVTEVPVVTEAPVVEGGTRAVPHSVGEIVAVSDDWAVTVTGPAIDMTAAIMAENPYNDAPPEGAVFVGVPVKVDFSGAEAASAAWELTFSAVGSSNVAYETAWNVVPGELDQFAELFGGASIEGYITFTVPADEVASMVVYVEASWSFDDDAEFFAVN